MVCKNHMHGEWFSRQTFYLVAKANKDCAGKLSTNIKYDTHLIPHEKWEEL